MPRFQNDLGNLTTICKSKDNGKIREYFANKGEDAFADYIMQQGGWVWLRKELAKISPVAADVLYREDVNGVPQGVVPRALASLAADGRIPAPTLTGLYSVWPVKFTASDEDWFALACMEEWKIVKAKKRESIVIKSE